MTEKPNQTENTLTLEQINLLISSLDLNSLPVTALKDLKLKVDEVLASAVTTKLQKNDLVLEYSITLKTQDGVVLENEGVARMNSIMNKRLIVDAPRRFETEFQNQVYSPAYAAALELFDTVGEAPAHNSLGNILQLFGGYASEALPGLPVGFGG